MPEEPSERIGCTRPSHPFQSPTTLTDRAEGAHTANATPAVPSISRRWAPRRSHSAWWRPSPEQVQVQLADGGQERVRIAPVHRVGVVLDLDLVGQGRRGALDDGLEQGGRPVGQLHRGPSVGVHAHGAGLGAPHAHHHAPGGRMGAEDGVGLVVVALGEQGDVAVEAGLGVHGSTRKMWKGDTSGSSRT